MPGQTHLTLRCSQAMFHVPSYTTLSSYRGQVQHPRRSSKVFPGGNIFGVPNLDGVDCLLAPSSSGSHPTQNPGPSPKRKKTKNHDPLSPKRRSTLLPKETHKTPTPLLVHGLLWEPTPNAEAALAVGPRRRAVSSQPKLGLTGDVARFRSSRRWGGFNTWSPI